MSGADWKLKLRLYPGSVEVQSECEDVLRLREGKWSDDIIQLSLSRRQCRGEMCSSRRDRDRPQYTSPSC